MGRNERRSGLLFVGSARLTRSSPALSVTVRSPEVTGALLSSRPLTVHRAVSSQPPVLVLPSVHPAPVSLCPVPTCASCHGHIHFPQSHRVGSAETRGRTSQGDSPASGETIVGLGNGRAVWAVPSLGCALCGQLKPSARLHPVGAALSALLSSVTSGLRRLSCLWPRTEQMV